MSKALAFGIAFLALAPIWRVAEFPNQPFAGIGIVMDHLFRRHMSPHIPREEAIANAKARRIIEYSGASRLG